MESLGTSVLSTYFPPVLSTYPQVIVPSNAGGPGQQGSVLRHGLFSTKRVLCQSTGRDAKRAGWSESVATRRQVLELANEVLAGAVGAVFMPSFSSAAETEMKSYSNIDDARIAGEKIREIKEAVDGPIITSSSGVKYRELEKGVGEPIGPGDVVSVYYTISRLNGYYLDSMGYGKEGKNDVGDTLNFEFGKGLVPEAVEGGMEGMQVGARRRILITPERGWVRPDLLPLPTSFWAERRLTQRNKNALLIEVELVKAKPVNE